MLTIQCAWNGHKSKKNVYPFISTNSNGVKKEVNSVQEHIKHALEENTARNVSLYAKLYLAGVNIEDYISDRSIILHSIYIDTKRYGMQYVYPTMDQTPALVKWGVDLIGAEYQRLENQKLKAQ